MDMGMSIDVHVSMSAGKAIMIGLYGSHGHHGQVMDKSWTF